MSLSLLLLLMVGSSQAEHFLGTVITYYPKDTFTNGSVQVVLRYKTNFNSCGTLSWACLSGVCGNESLVQNTVDTESSGEWCQQEGKSTRLVPTNAPFQLHLDGGNWIGNIQNVTGWKAVILVELRNRSDTGKANTSPQTTILPLLRVPSNCSRDFNLLAFDPDGDEVVCRHANAVNNECEVCTAPSFLSLSSSCSLSFRPTSSSNEGSYAVQLMMEDFPRQTISLTQTDSSQVQRSDHDSISKIPIQFVFRVDSAVPSCTEGLYLPRVLPPTPANREQLSTQVNQPLEISIKAEASVSSISELLFSGPYNTDQETLAAGDYVLRWTPSEDEVGESHPICFVVQANLSSMKYQSELRCVIVTVTPDTTASPSPVTNSQIFLKMRIKSAVVLSEEVMRNTVLQQITDELVKRGLPGNFTLRLINFNPTTTE
ncbi:uncharacterized protein LOC115058911 [Echeneis naucrates]|uniref:uncharacterized protein LOC115058911 n=1 Tax=Echeneis naucrates TaxID=173247 RepID=UPI0011135318|nr:uncharacterized protein LOC115058911 [Echeneis naucrates]